MEALKQQENLVEWPFWDFDKYQFLMNCTRDTIVALRQAELKGQGCATADTGLPVITVVLKK